MDIANQQSDLTRKIEVELIYLADEAKENAQFYKMRYEDYKDNLNLQLIINKTSPSFSGKMKILLTWLKMKLAHRDYLGMLRLSDYQQAILNCFQSGNFEPVKEFFENLLMTESQNLFISLDPVGNAYYQSSVLDYPDEANERQLYLNKLLGCLDNRPIQS